MEVISHIVPPDFKVKLDAVIASCKTIRKYNLKWKFVADLKKNQNS